MIGDGGVDSVRDWSRLRDSDNPTALITSRDLLASDADYKDVSDELQLR
jgi:hypothetical protein